MQIELNIVPDATLLGTEFGDAGGTSSEGLTQSQFFSYWQHSGIDNVFLIGYTSYKTDQTDTQNAVLDYGALLIELQFVNNDYIGAIQVNAGLHEAILDGFDPEGPLVVTWGQTVQMSWAQWNAEIIGMWGLATNPS